jgi:hypothetical protein
MKKKILVLLTGVLLITVNLYAEPGDVSVEGNLIVPNRPAFSVTLSNHWTAGGVIKFDVEVVDNGNNYDPATGRFTAPISGLYQICFGGIQAPALVRSYADIRVNGVRVPGGRVYSWGSDPDTRYDGTFKCIIVNLNASDYVDVENIDTTGRGWYKEPYALFSGHLL